MTNPSDSRISTETHHRRPREGERTRGAVDALQTKIAVGLQNLDPLRYMEQMQAKVDELPEATGADSAFIALISENGEKIETVLSSCTGFVDLHAELTHLLQPGNDPSQAERIATFSKI
jgi:hypothetical protein